MTFWKSLALFVPVIAISACSGGGGGPAEVDTTPEEIAIDLPTPTPEVPVEDDEATSPPVEEDNTPPTSDEFGTQTPDAVDTSDPNLLAALAAFNAETTALQAVALVNSASDGERSLTTRVGEFVSADETLSLAGAAVAVNNDVLGNFDNAASFSQADAVGIVGLATAPADIRTNGTAIYDGGAAGFVIVGDNGVDLTNGQSLVQVDFASNSASVTLDGFEGVSQISGLVVDAPVTEIQLDDVTIANGGFTGGTLTTRDADGVVDITGANTTTLSQGQFFGLEADGETPDEVGGVILSEGDSGVVFGAFIAD